MPEGQDLSWTPYAWLVYLLAVAVDPIIRHASAHVWLTTLAGMAVFLVLYFRSYWVEGWQTIAIIVADALLGAWFAPTNGFATTYFIFGACTIAWIGRPRAAYPYLAGYLVFVATLCFARHIEIGQTLTTLTLSALLGAVVIRQAEVKCSNAVLRLAHAEVGRLAKMAERERIARDMHDVLGHTLSVIVLKSELAAKFVEVDIARAIAEIRDVEKVARESLSELREALSGYRASGINEEFVRARNVLETAGVRFDCETENLPLTPSQESVFALALREGVTNIVRHARANSCHVRLARDADAFRLEIADDGKGDASTEGAGLSGMRERIEALGGTFVRDARSGTHLILTLPTTADAH